MHLERQPSPRFRWLHRSPLSYVFAMVLFLVIVHVAVIAVALVLPTMRVEPRTMLDAPEPGSPADRHCRTTAPESELLQGKRFDVRCLSSHPWHK